MSALKNSDKTVKLKISDNNYCIIHLYGSTLISWVCRGEERIFLSSKATFDSGKSAIRGGIPIVFPNFGPWAHGPQHGFARLSWWKVEEPIANDELGNKSVVLSLEDNEFTRQFWNYKFQLLVEFTLDENSLDLSLTIKNLDLTTFSFTCLLHTYFSVPDVSEAIVIGIQGSVFNDRINNKKENVENDELKFDGLIDSLYHGTKDTQYISCGQQNKIQIVKHNFKDTVIWNPWLEKGSEMKDMGADEWKKMICVESGCIVDPKTLKPGDVFVASQTIKIL